MHQKKLQLNWILVLLFGLCIRPESVLAQGASLTADPRNSYDLNLNFGTMISANTGLNDDVPGWGLRYSIPTSKGIFEIGGFSGIGHGITYRSATFDYRMDVVLETIASHFLLGFHGDQFEATSPTLASSKFSGGWHYGGGVTQVISGPMLFRFDFRHRFSPGQAIEVTIGFTYRYPSGGQ